MQRMTKRVGKKTVNSMSILYLMENIYYLHGAACSDENYELADIYENILHILNALQDHEIGTLDQLLDVLNDAKEKKISSSNGLPVDGLNILRLEFIEGTLDSFCAQLKDHAVDMPALEVARHVFHILKNKGTCKLADIYELI